MTPSGLDSARCLLGAPCRSAGGSLCVQGQLPQWGPLWPLPVPSPGGQPCPCGFSRGLGEAVCVLGGCLAERLQSLTLGGCGLCSLPPAPVYKDTHVCWERLGQQVGRAREGSVCERGRGREVLSFPGRLCPVHEFPGIIFPIKLGGVSFCHLREYSDSAVYPRAGLGQPCSPLECPQPSTSPTHQEMVFPSSLRRVELSSPCPAPPLLPPSGALHGWPWHCWGCTWHPWHSQKAVTLNLSARSA